MAAPRLARATLIGLALLVAIAALPSETSAQAAPRTGARGWHATRIAKWTLLAAAVGFGYWAYVENDRADDAYDRLRSLCTADVSRCAISGGGYADPEAEALFDESNTRDRRARIGLVAGQATLLGSAAFFIVDIGDDDSPDNIPYDPNAGTRRGARVRVGIRIPTP